MGKAAHAKGKEKCVLQKKKKSQKNNSLLPTHFHFALLFCCKEKASHSVILL